MIRKQRSKGAGGSDGMFGDLLAPKVDWRKALRDFITETCSGRDESSWARPNRRFLSDDVYMPSMMGVTLRELVVGFDTSGSVFGGSEMTRFVSEITTIIEQVKPSKVHVIYWDTAVAGHQTFEDGQFAVQNLKPKGGGGTDGSVLFDYLRKKRITPDAIVQFTDGYVGDWGRSDVPTLWAVTSDIKAPFGTTIQLEV
jgi:predicted metal-dependent peptidase